MPLEKLLLLVETLKARIEKHGDALKGSEALTRYTLIDPLLRALGWDTADPSLVIPEFKSGKGWADYALLEGDGKPAMMIEAKSLGTPLHDEARTKGITYCIALGTKYFALTDGNRWEIYETYRAVPIDEKLIVEFNVTTQLAAEVCLQALALWRPSLEAGRAVPGYPPLIQPEPTLSHATEPRTVPAETASVISIEKDWQPLSKIQPPKGAPSPVEILFPDNSRKAVKFWVGIVREITRWLQQNKHLHADLCPIRQSDSSTWFLVANDPVHSTGKKFRDSEQVETVWIEKDYVIPNLAENARTIIRHVGQDPAQFKVRFD